ERCGFPSEADLATLEETVQYTLYDPYNWKEDRTVRQKVLTYAGKKQLSDLKFTFNPAQEHISLVEATVTSPDGRMKYIDPEKEINVMDAQWVAEAPRYPAGKIMVASLPGVEVGSTIEYHTVSINRGLPFFSAAEYFSGHNPLVSKTVRIELPYKMEMEINSPDPHLVRRFTRAGNGTVIHEWSVQNRDMVKKEEHLPPEWISQPTVLLSCGDIPDYSAQVEKTLLKAAGQNKAAKAKTRELTRHLKTRTEKITALRNFVDRAVRPAGPGFSALPLSAVTPADQVLAEGYGNTADRAVLLYALLDAAGLNPRFILSSSLPRGGSASLPAITTLQRGFFDSVLVTATGDKDQTVYLGDSSQYAEPGTLAHDGRPAIDLKDGQLEIPQSKLPDSIETRLGLILSENGDIRLSRKSIFFGTLFEKFHQQFAQFTPEERRREYQSLLSSISQSAEAASELQTSFTYPGNMEFTATLPGYAVHDGDCIYMNLPEGLDDLLNLKASRRENPFYIENPICRAFLYEITLPEGWEPVLIPGTFRIELPAGAGTVETRMFSSSGKILILQQAQINAAIIPPEDYDKLLALNGRLTAPSAKAILLRKK
ncbi:MAG: DUF3857 domain-containing protein, partial [Kiritimatiellales bacterium]